MRSLTAPSSASHASGKWSSSAASGISLLWQLLLFAGIGFGLSLLLAPLRQVLVLVSAMVAAPLVVFVLLPSAVHVKEALTTTLRSVTIWHWLLLFVVLSGLTFRLRDAQDIDALPVDGWAFVRVLLDCVVAAALLIRVLNGRSPWARPLVHGVLVPLSLYVTFSAFSALWSVRPSWTLYKAVEYGVVLVLVATLAASAYEAADFVALFRWMWVLVGLAVITVWIGALIAPGDAFSYGQEGLFRIPELSGVWPLQAANSVGDLGALLSIVAFGRLLMNSPGARRRLYWVVLGAGLATMFMAQCRSAIGGFVVGAVLLLILARRLLVGVILGAAAAFAAMATGFGSELWSYLLRSQSLADVSGLSGRIEWWSAAWRKIIERPLVGWGGFAGGRFLVLVDAGSSTTADIHSTIMETLLDTGTLGLLFLLLAVIGTWYYMWRGAHSDALEGADRRQCMECLAVFGVLSVRSLVSTTFVAHSYMTITFLLIAGYSEYIRRCLKKHRRRRAPGAGA